MLTMFRVVLPLLTLLSLLPAASADGENYTLWANPEVKLVDMLLKNCNPNAKPFYGNYVPIQVWIAFVLGRISDVDEKSQVLTTFGWFYLTWWDTHLNWDASEHYNITILFLDPKDIWMPEIAIHNTVDVGNDLSLTSKFRVQVRQGLVSWNPGFRLVTECKVDLTYFPFDQQTCEINIVTWSFPEEMVKYYPMSDKIQLDTYQPNEEWDLIDTEVRQLLDGSRDEYKVPYISHVLHLKRKPKFYLLNIVIPTIIMSLISLMVFVLPAASGEKISLGISILLFYSVLTLLVSDIMPRNSETLPYLGLYLTACMSLTGASLIVTVCVINIHHHCPNSKVPPLVRTIFLYGLARVLCMSSTYKTCMTAEKPVGGDQNESGKTPRLSVFKVDEANQNVFSQPGLLPPESIMADGEDGIVQGSRINDWQLLASVLDRLFLVLFTVAIVLTSGILLGVIGNH